MKTALPTNDTACSHPHLSRFTMNDDSFPGPLAVRSFRQGMLVALGVSLLVVPATRAQSLEQTPWLPRPQQVAAAAGRLALRDGLTIQISPTAPTRVAEIADFLRDGLRAATGIAARIESSDAPPSTGSVRLVLMPDSSAGAESYTLRIGRHVELRAGAARGLFWGVQTLLQGIETGPAKTPSLACGEIADHASYPWRAVMLDPVRSFLDLDFIRRTIRVMSAYKLNVLHLHLIDDHAWRFESKAFPRCNPPGELFYTQAELKELVAFAQRLGVEIVPEFDFPGHAHAAVDAYPDLDCEGKRRAMDEAIFCAGKPFTWEFMDRVIAEAAGVFPSRYLHLGADEPFAVKRWDTCPHCRERMQARGVADVAQLYHTFVADLNTLVQRHGRRMIVWNDAITPGVAPMPPKDILIDAWTNDKKVKALAAEGYTLVNSSIRPLYLSSYSQRDGFPLAAVWQWTPQVFGLREARSTDAELKSTPLPEQTRLLGGQACAWASDQCIMERRLYPRLLAVAETLWSGSQRADFADFSARLASDHAARLHRLGVPDEDALPKDTLFAGQNLGVWATSAHAGFEIVNDVLHAPDGSATAVLRSPKSYRDFVLTFERRASTNTGHTGFVIRCAPPSADANPDGFVVRSSPPPGMKIVAQDVATLAGWNRFELVARGSVVSLTVNGYLAWSVTDPAPRAGPVLLRGDGDGFEIRNVEIRSLDGEASPAFGAFPM